MAYSNNFWTSDNKPDGGMSSGNGFSITWPRSGGSGDTDGASLSDVLMACRDWLAHLNEITPCKESVMAERHIDSAIAELSRLRARAAQKPQQKDGSEQSNG